MARKFKKKVKKYNQKGPSSRIKNPVRPIKKTVIGKDGKPIERTYYKLVSKNNKIGIERKSSQETKPEGDKVKSEINKKEKLKFKIDLNDLKKIDKQNISIKNNDNNIYNAKNVSELSEKLGVNEEAMRQFICKI